MKNKPFTRYYLLACLGVLLASCYPLSMGVGVIRDMIVDGVVLKENYPKYVIPYTPISLALLLSVLLMPLCFKLFKRFAAVGGITVAIGAFFLFELFFEQNFIIADGSATATLEDWQMAMCWVPPEMLENAHTYKTQTAIEILMGDYDPAFKLHFYLISVVLLLAVINCLYGFGQMVRTGDRKRLNSLVMQSVCAAGFLGLCILACFTAFWRDGSIEVSPLSAGLMAVFFILLGVTAGTFAGSFLLGKGNFFSVWLPAIIAALTTTLMYIGEMILLNGHLYQLGEGFFFDSLPAIVLSPADIAIILLAGIVTYLPCRLLNRKLHTT